MDKNNDELINEYNDLRLRKVESDEKCKKLKEYNIELEEQVVELVEENKKQCKKNKYHDKYYTIQQWHDNDQIKHDETAETSFTDLCSYYECWGELVYGRNFKFDKKDLRSFLSCYKIPNKRALYYLKIAGEYDSDNE